MLNVRNYPLVSDQIEYPELAVIIRELEKILITGVEGEIVELGCYTGTTSLFIQRVLVHQSNPRKFHVYDSFGGLPPKVVQDQSPAGEQFIEGELTASKQQFIKHFKQANIPLPVIHKCWFEQLVASDLPQKVAFAFLDGDFYTSIQSSLAVVTPQLSKGAVIIVDDYQSESLPGARKGVDEWVLKHGLTLRVEQSLAVIIWKG